MPPSIEADWWRRFLLSRMEAKGWSQADLSREVGIPGSYISRWISLSATPSTKHFYKVLCVLGYDLEGFLGIGSPRAAATAASGEEGERGEATRAVEVAGYVNADKGFGIERAPVSFSARLDADVIVALQEFLGGRAAKPYLVYLAQQRRGEAATTLLIVRQVEKARDIPSESLAIISGVGLDAGGSPLLRRLTWGFELSVPSRVKSALIEPPFAEPGAAPGRRVFMRAMDIKPVGYVVASVDLHSALAAETPPLERLSRALAAIRAAIEEAG
ncbi:MAG: helix-turn-helix transcriptional regulator [Sumerlaeia bacterium]